MSERKIIFLVAAVQFVNFVDFMMVMPLGPDFAEALGISLSQLGVVGASYTFAAFVSGLLGTLFLDRFDRRSALLVCLVGLVGGTALGGFAQGLPSLIAARMVAGAFGGPAAALGFAIVSDVVAPERRGRAMGALMGAFSASAVLGVPVGLELAHRWGWKAPFFTLAAVGLVLGVMAAGMLPPLRQHLIYRAQQVHSPLKEMIDLFLSRKVQLAAFTQFCTMAAGFLLVPNLAAYVQYNAGYPRDGMGTLYLCGGAISFFAMRLAGNSVDRFGVFPVILIITAALIANLVEGFLFGAPMLPVLPMFLLFMTCQTMRNVSVQSITTKVPLPRERARYQSLLTAVQHLATASGAFASTLFLVEVPGPRLAGIPGLTATAIGLSLCVPLGIALLDRRLRGQEY